MEPADVLAAEAAKAVLEPRPDFDYVALIARIAALPDRGRGVLDNLAADRHAAVRSWAAVAAADALGRDGSDLLVRLLRDRSHEVSTEAIDQLRSVDPEALRRQLPYVTKLLRSTEYMVPILGLWTLAGLNASEAATDVRQYAARPDVDPWQVAVAGIVLDLLEGRERAVLDAIRRHDHDRMSWLTNAARYVRSPEAEPVLEKCSSDAPDQECRERCREALKARRSAPPH